MPESTENTNRINNQSRFVEDWWSVISTKAIISAIHCFWDASNEGIFDKENYDIAVGKSRRGLDDVETYKSQIFKVSNILYDYARYYANDIAVVILNNFIEFKTYIAPVCIQFDLKCVEPGLIGTVAGWGLESQDGQPSIVLKLSTFYVA